MKPRDRSVNFSMSILPPACPVAGAGDQDTASGERRSSRIWEKGTCAARGRRALAQTFFPRWAKPMMGEDVFRGFIPRKTDGGKDQFASASSPSSSSVPPSVKLKDAPLV